MKKYMLEVGFWFGFATPQEGDEYFSTQFDSNNMITSYDRFEIDYEEFKKRNTDPEVPYKDNLADEECLIFFPEPIGTIHTTFATLKDMGYLFHNLQSEKTPIPKNWGIVSIGEVFSDEEVNRIHTIYENSMISGYPLQKALNNYFLSIKAKLSQKGYDATYLSYAIANVLQG